MEKRAVHVYYTNEMPCEVAAAAFSAQHDSVTTRAHTISEAKSWQHADLDPTEAHAVMIGSYWNASLLSTKGYASITVYVFGKPPTGTFSPGITFVSGEERKIGPCAFLLEYLCAPPYVSKSFTALGGAFASVLELSDERIFGRKMAESQVLYTGMYNAKMPSESATLFDRFCLLFQGRLNIDDVLRNGASILESQLLFVRERALKNSIIVTLANGSKAVVTNAPDFINITHEALHSANMDAPVTIALALRCSDADKSIKLAYSVRSWDTNVRADDYIKELLGANNADGNGKAAGGRTEIQLRF